MTFVALKNYVINTIKTNAKELGYNWAVGKTDLIAPSIVIEYYQNGIKTTMSGLPCSYILNFDLYVTIEGSEDNETAIDKLAELTLKIVNLFANNIIYITDIKTLGNVFYPDKLTALITFNGNYDTYE